MTGTWTTNDTAPPRWPEEYAAARVRVRALLESASAQDAATIVPACPEWTVRDLVAHVSGLAVGLTSGPGPGGRELQEWLDELVDERRDRDLAELLDEWEAAGPAVGELLGRMGAGGGQLVYDLVAHEHDIRHALDRAGDRDSSGVRACAEAMSVLLARDLAAHGLGSVQVSSGGRTWVIGEGEIGLAIALDPFELIRVFGSRRSEAQLRALPWQGDLDTYLPALAHLPLPVADLVE